MKRKLKYLFLTEDELEQLPCSAIILIMSLCGLCALLFSVCVAFVMTK